MDFRSNVSSPPAVSVCRADPRGSHRSNVDVTTQDSDQNRICGTVKHALGAALGAWQCATASTAERGRVDSKRARLHVGAATQASTFAAVSQRNGRFVAVWAAFIASGSEQTPTVYTFRLAHCFRTPSRRRCCPLVPRHLQARARRPARPSRRAHKIASQRATPRAIAQTSVVSLAVHTR